MFMFLLLAAYPTSLLGLSDHDSERSPGLSRVGERSRAPSDHGVKRVREAAVRTAIEAIDAAEVSGLLEVALDEAHVAGVVEAVPDLDRLRGKAAVSKPLHPTNPPGFRFECRSPSIRAIDRRWGWWSPRG